MVLLLETHIFDPSLWQSRHSGGTIWLGEGESSGKEWGNNKNWVCVPHCALHQSAVSKATTGLTTRPNHQALASRWNKYIKLWGIIKMTDEWVSSEMQHY